jgi:hypothetical protein
MPLSEDAQIWADKSYSKAAKQIDAEYKEQLIQFARGLVKRDDVESRQGTYGYIDERILANKSKATIKADILREAFERDKVPFSESIIDEIMISVSGLLESLNAHLLINERTYLEDFKTRTGIDEGHAERLTEIQARLIKSWQEITTEIKENLQIVLADYRLKEKAISQGVARTVESVSSGYLQEFNDLIRPFNDIFDQLSITCIAVRTKDKWVSLFTRLALNNSADAGSTQEQVIEIGSNFLALFIRSSPKALGAMLEELTTKNSLSFATGEKTFQVFVNLIAAGLVSQMMARPEPSFHGIVRPMREYAEDKLHYRPCIEIHSIGDRVCELISSDDIERVSKQLRAHKYPYSGLDALLKAMGRRINTSSLDQSILEVAAVLPFNIRFTEEILWVECPESIARKASITYFFSNSSSSMASELYSVHEAITGRQGCCSISFKVPWPVDALQADAYIRYAGEEVEKFTIRNWAGASNWRVAVDHFFDPTLNFLRQTLKTAKESAMFEHAIVRLLNLGGLTTIWHGTSRQKGRPDLVAYYEGPTRRVVLLGECTLDKPEAKFSPLTSRANELRKLVDQVEVLPVVFTACDPVQPDYEKAANSAIALYGAAEIAELLDLVENYAGAQAILKEIEKTITEPGLAWPIPRSAYTS